MQVRSIAQVLAVVALSLLAASAYAAPRDIVKLPRVVIVGKAQAAQVAQIEKLPRVVVVGFNQATLAQRELLAANSANSADSAKSAKAVRVASL